MANYADKFKLIPSVYVMLLQDSRILLLLRSNTGWEDGKYGLVAGHADGNETMTQAIIREAREEAGINLFPDNLKMVLTMHRWCGDHERVDFFFTATQWSGEIINYEPEKCEKLEWFSADLLPKNTIEQIRVAVDCYRRGQNYIEFGWPIK